VASLDIIDNVVPFIGDEEPKVESEPLKILGTLNGD
jgi:aspartate-semialdehyde dehydrogenase